MVALHEALQSAIGGANGAKDKAAAAGDSQSGLAVDVAESPPTPSITPCRQAALLIVHAPICCCSFLAAMHAHASWRRNTRCLGYTGGSTLLRTCILQGCKDVLGIFRPLCADAAAPHGGVPTRDPASDGSQTASEDAQPTAITPNHASSCAGTCKAGGGMEEPAGRCRRSAFVVHAS